jgi:hypothetical protein
VDADGDRSIDADEFYAYTTEKMTEATAETETNPK